MKSIRLLFFILLILSCNEKDNIGNLSGYWEIESVTLNGQNVKKFPFSNTIDYFEFDDSYEGFRKKVKPRIDGSFDITMHQIKFRIEKNNGNFSLIYGKGDNFVEYITEIDSNNLIIKNKDGYLYKYKRFLQKNYLDE